MTTQTQLLQLAEKHKGSPAIDAILLALMEDKVQAGLQLRLLQSQSEIMQKAVNGEPGYRVVNDYSDIVTAVARASTAASRMASSYLTLATVLQSLGEDISY